MDGGVRFALGSQGQDKDFYVSSSELGVCVSLFTLCRVFGPPFGAVRLRCKLLQSADV